MFILTDNGEILENLISSQKDFFLQYLYDEEQRNKRAIRKLEKRDLDQDIIDLSTGHILYKYKEEERPQANELIYEITDKGLKLNNNNVVKRKWEVTPYPFEVVHKNIENAVHQYFLDRRSKLSFYAVAYDLFIANIFDAEYFFQSLPDEKFWFKDEKGRVVAKLNKENFERAKELFKEQAVLIYQDFIRNATELRKSNSVEEIETWWDQFVETNIDI